VTQVNCSKLIYIIKATVSKREHTQPAVALNDLSNCETKDLLKKVFHRSWSEISYKMDFCIRLS